VNDAPTFLVEWPSRWDEFSTAIGPALGKSPKRLAGEAQVGLFPWWGILLSWALELLLLVAAIVVPSKLASMQPYEVPPKPKYDIIYYSSNELPRTEDVGGAQAGRSGRSGGREAHHPTQTIRVARGSTVRETVADAPKLDLPKSNSAVANLLALKALPGPAPAEGMRSSQRAPALTQTAVAPAPQVPEQMRATPQMNIGVVPPSAAVPQREVSTLRLPGSNPVQVVPPPVSAPEQATNLNPRLAMPAPSVVAPPPTMATEVARTGPGFGPGDLQNQIVPPAVQVGNASAARQISGLGSTSVVPPTVQLGAGAAQRSVAGGMGTGAAVVPPPPSVSAGGSLTGQGRGNRGAGLGGPLDAGVASAPPTSNSGGSTSGVVVSSQPGSKVGLPGNGGSGALAMSPSGGDKPGIGGSGGGGGVGRGDGPGSGFSGPGAGAGKEGAGPGSDPMARGGISPYPGPGGAGTGTNGTPAMPGVSVKGGSSSIVTLPSFGSGAKPASSPGRSNTTPGNHGPDITIVASSRSGGAFNFYGALKGDKVYTIYITTALGTAVMQFADPASASHGYAEDLTAPQAMRSELPAGLPKARLVIACVLDRTGSLRRPQVLEPATAVMTSKVLIALNSWKFSPALRGNEPIEVNAILGFNIDTNDRF
jgi:hypothetical protein